MMVSYKMNDSFSEKIQEAILSVCTENYSSQGLEVDGIVCISFRNPESNCVVKIHKNLDKADGFLCQQNWNLQNSNHNEHFQRRICIQNSIENNENSSFNDISFEPEFTPQERSRDFLSGSVTNSKECIVAQENNSRTELYKSQTNQEKIPSDHAQICNNTTDLNKEQFSFQNQNISISTDIGEIVKIEQEEQSNLSYNETSEEWNVPSKTNTNKRNNLETIIERFSNQNQCIGLNGNGIDDSHDSHNSESRDIVRNDQNYNDRLPEDVINSNEKDDCSVGQYNRPVCIDLSESDPDLYQVKMEIEEHVDSEVQNFKTNYSSERDFSHGLANELELSERQGTSNIGTQNPAVANCNANDLSIKNIKCVSLIKPSLQEPRKYKADSSLSGLSDQRKIFCKYCGMGFTNSGNKNRHERSTCGAVKYKCEFCNSLFSRSDSRARHMLYSHGLAIKDRPSNTPKKNNIKLSVPKPNFLNSNILKNNFQGHLMNSSSKEDGISPLMTSYDKQDGITEQFQPDQSSQCNSSNSNILSHLES